MERVRGAIVRYADRIIDNGSVKLSNDKVYDGLTPLSDLAKDAASENKGILVRVSTYLRPGLILLSEGLSGSLSGSTSTPLWRINRDIVYLTMKLQYGESIASALMGKIKSVSPNDLSKLSSQAEGRARIKNAILESLGKHSDAPLPGELIDALMRGPVTVKDVESFGIDPYKWVVDRFKSHMEQKYPEDFSRVIFKNYDTVDYWLAHRNKTNEKNIVNLLSDLYFMEQKNNAYYLFEFAKAEYSHLFAQESIVPLINKYSNVSFKHIDNQSFEILMEALPSLFEGGEKAVNVVKEELDKLLATRTIFYPEGRQGSGPSDQIG